MQIHQCQKAFCSVCLLDIIKSIKKCLFRWGCFIKVLFITENYGENDDGEQVIRQNPIKVIKNYRVKNELRVIDTPNRILAIDWGCFDDSFAQ